MTKQSISIDYKRLSNYGPASYKHPEKECNSIQAKYMPTVLSKMGINRSTPTEVRSGPALYASMSVSELWPLQGSTKNKLLIGHLQKSDNVGTNLQVELDCLQLQAGVSWDVLSREGTMI
jgi:hypothetical protein